MQNIAIVKHRSLMPDIPGGDLKKFFLEKGIDKLIYITHPLLLLKESYKLSSQYEFYNKQKVKSKKAHQFHLPEPLSYIKDFFYTIFWIIKCNEKFDLYFGINNMNALAGIILKLLGRVEKVIYYTIDLYPQRFNNKAINFIYHKVDNFCVKYCDETWNVSPFLVNYRKKKGVKSKKQITVPIGIWYSEIKRAPLSKIKRNKIVYVGHLKNFYGVDLIIKAIPLIREKIPNIKLEIIGGGEQLKELQQLVDKLAIKQHVIFLGWKQKKEAEGLMADAALGLAPFNTVVDEKIKNADPAKIKDYLALGLPVIMTDATLNADAIKKSKSGIIIEYTPKSLANAVIKLLSNEKLLKIYKKNALLYVKQFDWNNLFSSNLRRLI